MSEIQQSNIHAQVGISSTTCSNIRNIKDGIILLFIYQNCISYGVNNASKFPQSELNWARKVISRWGFEARGSLPPRGTANWTASASNCKKNEEKYFAMKERRRKVLQICFTVDFCRVHNTFNIIHRIHSYVRYRLTSKYIFLYKVSGLLLDFFITLENIKLLVIWVAIN